MNYKKTIFAIIISGLVYLVASNILGIVTQLILPYDWSAIAGMRQLTNPIFSLLLAYGFVASIGAVLFYKIANLKGRVIQKGAKFGALMWLVVNIPSSFIIYATMEYPAGFFLENIFFGLIIWMLMGISIAWVFEEKKPKKRK